MYKDLKVYGRGYKPIPCKLRALKDFKYHVVIENDPDFFTEKLIDCFVTGTIPIFWGDQDIGDHFNLDGILRIESPKDIEFLNCKYEERLDAIKDNFKRAKEYVFPEISIKKILSDFYDGDK